MVRWADRFDIKLETDEMVLSAIHSSNCYLIIMNMRLAQPVMPSGDAKL